MNFKNLATQLVMSHIDGANSSNHAASALDRLVGGNKTFDLGDLLSTLQNSRGNVARKAKSWLGDGANEPVSAAQIEKAIGQDKVSAFGRALGIDRDLAAAKLAQILPDLIDKSSQSGVLLNKLGEKRGLAHFASRLFKKSA